MKLEELLKDSPEVLKAVTDAIEKANEGQEDKLKHIRFADLSEGGYVSKDKYTGMETDYKSKEAELAKANELIEQLKKGTGKDQELQSQITKYESEIEALRNENVKLKTDTALKFALASAGAVDVDYLMFKAQEKGEIKLDADGKIKGESDLISGLKVQHPAMFGGTSVGQQQVNRKVLTNDLPGGDQTKTVTKEEFGKMGYNDRLKIFNENPELYSELTKK